MKISHWSQKYMWLCENILITEETSTITDSNLLSEQKMEILHYSETWKGGFFLQTSLWQGSPWSYITKKTLALGNSRAQQKWPRTIEQLELDTLHACGMCFKILYFVLGLVHFASICPCLASSSARFNERLVYPDTSQVQFWFELKY